MAKLFARRGSGADLPMSACQIHGGYGLIKDYPAGEVLPRRKKLCTIGEKAPANSTHG